MHWPRQPPAERLVNDSVARVDPFIRIGKQLFVMGNVLRDTGTSLACDLLASCSVLSTAAAGIKASSELANDSDRPPILTMS